MVMDYCKQPEVPQGFALPFYYAYLNNIEIFYLVQKETVLPYLRNSKLLPVIFDNKALVSYNFQLYLGQFSAGINAKPEELLTTCANITQELELNVIVSPENYEQNFSFKQFILGEDQTKIIGNYGLFVPCDADVAIAAGKTLFEEPKFKTTFKTNLPSFNPVKSNATAYEPKWVNKWGFQVNDPVKQDVSILTCLVDITGLSPVPANPSPITQYGFYNKRRIACRWNILQPMLTYFLSGNQHTRVELSIGTSSHPMKEAIKNLIGETPAKAVRIFNSSPVAIQSRAYYS